VGKATILQLVVLIFLQRNNSLVVSLNKSKHAWGIDDASLGFPAAFLGAFAACAALAASSAFAAFAASGLAKFAVATHGVQEVLCTSHTLQLGSNRQSFTPQLTI